MHFGYYNFCRVHQTPRGTPAMESILTDHVWNINEALPHYDEAQHLVLVIHVHAIYRIATENYRVLLSLKTSQGKNFGA